ncbi:MAG: addiction module protein [Candidatus Acidiferrales bacterium]
MRRGATVEYSMGREAKRLLKKALTLPVDERAELAGSLIESLDSSTDKGVRAAWEIEVLGRMQELDLGRVKAIPIGQFRRRLTSAK